ncbi:MAG: hypothetical protein Q9160_000725 [Pyrenula sp. 1 TL-2023]
MAKLVAVSEAGTIPASTVPTLPERYADESYKLFSQIDVSEPSPEKAREIRKKCLWRVMPFLCIGYHLMYIDKQTLGSSSILVITGAITIIFGVFVWILFPDNPLQAKFLTVEERAQAILRIKENHSGIEQKHFKKYQFIEALKDPKSWLFFLHSWSQEMANGTTNQYSLIIKSFGFSTPETTLLGCVTGGTALVSLLTAALILHKTTDCRARLSSFSYLFCVVSSVLLMALPWSNKWGLVTGIWLRSPGGIPYSIVMIWAANCSAGHTKKTTVIALYHIGYGLGNILSPQLFQGRWRPRYYPTWTVILIVASILPAIIVLYLRYYLVRENRRRDALAAAKPVMDDGVVESYDEDGIRITHVVNANQLDLTDRENLTFRYVL